MEEKRRVDVQAGFSKLALYIFINRESDRFGASLFIPYNWNTYLYHHIDSLQSSTLSFFLIFFSITHWYLKFFNSNLLLIYLYRDALLNICESAISAGTSTSQISAPGAWVLVFLQPS